MDIIFTKHAEDRLAKRKIEKYEVIQRGAIEVRCERTENYM